MNFENVTNGWYHPCQQKDLLRNLYCYPFRQITLPLNIPLFMGLNVLILDFGDRFVVYYYRLFLTAKIGVKSTTMFEKAYTEMVAPVYSGSFYSIESARFFHDFIVANL